MNIGSFQDGKGRTVDFTNTIIVLTSNIGAQYILEDVENQVATGKLSQTIKDRVMKEVSATTDADSNLSRTALID